MGGGGAGVRGEGGGGEQGYKIYTAKLLTVEVSAKFTALIFLYKFYSPAPHHHLHPARPRRPAPTFLPSYIEVGLVVSDKKIFKFFYEDIQGK